MRVNNHFEPAVARSNPNLMTNDLQTNGMKRKFIHNTSPDRGEGWGVVIGTALITMLVNSLLTCTGIIGQQIRGLFPTTTNYVYLSLLNAVMFALWNFLGPVTSLLLGVFSCRTIAITGGILLSLAISLSSQSYNSSIFFFTYAVLGGIGAGLVLNPGALLLNRYFRKQKPLASGICLFISTSGQIILPYFIISIKNAFKPSGTILLLGGILLHVCVAGMLFRPGPSSCKGVSDMRHILTLNPTGHGQACLIQIRKQNSQRKRRSTNENVVIITPKNGKIVIPANSLRLARIRTYSTGSRTSALPDIPEEQEPLENDDAESKNQTENISTNRGQKKRIKRSRSFGSQLTQLASNSSINSIPRTERRPRSSSENLGRVSSFSTMTTSRPKNGICTEKATISHHKTPEAAICNFVLLRNPLYVLIVIASSVLFLTYPNVLFFTTINEHQLGNTDYKLALLLSLFVLCDMISRFLIAWLLPQGFLRPQKILIILSLLTLPSLSAFLISKNFILHCISLGVYGFGCGGCSVVISSIVLEYVGFQQFPAGLMLLQFIQGLVFAAVTPILGVILDETCKIRYLYYVFMSLHTIIVIICLLEPLFISTPKSNVKRKAKTLQRRSLSPNNSFINYSRATLSIHPSCV